VYFGVGYIGQSTWWKIGLIMSAVNVFVWLTVGMVWWKLIGFW
jgi:DASS family divalent anion:Na+ symporter